MPKLKNWGVLRMGSSYDAPECWTNALGGEVYGHSSFKDGEYIVTSTVICVINHSGVEVATTRSGTDYELGVPSREFLDVLAKDGLTLQDAISRLRW